MRTNIHTLHNDGNDGEIAPLRLNFGFIAFVVSKTSGCIEIAGRV